MVQTRVKWNKRDWNRMNVEKHRRKIKWICDKQIENKANTNKENVKGYSTQNRLKTRVIESLKFKEIRELFGIKLEIAR